MKREIALRLEHLQHCPQGLVSAKDLESTELALLYLGTKVGHDSPSLLFSGAVQDLDDIVIGHPGPDAAVLAGCCCTCEV